MRCYDTQLLGLDRNAKVAKGWDATVWVAVISPLINIYIYKNRLADVPATVWPKTLI